MDDKYMQMIIETNESVKSAHKRIDRVEKEVGEIKELTIAVKELAIETKETRKEVNDMNSRLKVVEEKPAKNWENLIKTIITRNCNSSSGLFFSKIRIIEGCEKYVRKNRKFNQCKKHCNNNFYLCSSLFSSNRKNKY